LASSSAAGPPVGHGAGGGVQVTAAGGGVKATAAGGGVQATAADGSSGGGGHGGSIAGIGQANAAGATVMGAGQVTAGSAGNKYGGGGGGGEGGIHGDQSPRLTSLSPASRRRPLEGASAAAPGRTMSSSANGMGTLPIAAAPPTREQSLEAGW